MVQFLSINFFFLGFLQFLLGFSKVPVFCVILYKGRKRAPTLTLFLQSIIFLTTPECLIGLQDIIRMFLRQNALQTQPCCLRFSDVVTPFDYLARLTAQE